MTPRLARDQTKNITIRRRIGGNPIVKKRRSTGDLKKYLKKQLPAPVPLLAIEAAPSTSWDCVFTSWTTCNVVEMTNSEICTAEFAAWTIFDEDFGNDAFLGECMRLYGVWCWLLEEIELSSDTVTTNTVFENECNSWTEDSEKEYRVCTCDCEEQGMAMYGMLRDEDEEEVSVEPEEQDSHLMAALLSTKDLLPYPSAGAMRALSCPDLLVSSLAALLFETRHLHYINERMALPAPPKWMAALEAIREMDPPNTLASTVSLPSGWDAVSARLSSSSIFNLFSDRPASPIPSLFNIDPTGAPSTVASTVSVPQSFWNTSSTVSVTGSVPEESVVSIPSTFFMPQEVTSSTSSLFQHPSMFGGRCPSSSSASSLFLDPTSAHSSSSIFSVDPSGSSSTSSTTSSLSSLISTSDSFCSVCQVYHGQVPTSSTTSEESESSDDDSDKSCEYCYSSEADNISFRADSDDDFAPRRRTNPEYQVVEMTSSDEESTISSSSDEEVAAPHLRAYPLYHTESTTSSSSDSDDDRAPRRRVDPAYQTLARLLSSVESITTSSSSDSDDDRAPRRRVDPAYQTLARLFSSDDSINTYTVSSASSGYVSDDEPAAVVLQTASTSTSTQTEALNQAEVARMLAECDSILEKLEAMKKNLEELLD